jgi:hypothetical protein
MKWKEEVIIEGNIDKIWSLFLDEHIHKIMPKVEEHTIIEKAEDQVGAKHRQSYREGKRLETYIVETLAYDNHEDRKHKQISFVLGKAFKITLAFTLIKVDATHTKFVYEGKNEGINFVGRAMLKLGSEKSNQSVVKEFMQRVEQEALKL